MRARTSAESRPRPARRCAPARVGMRGARRRAAAAARRALRCRRSRRRRGRACSGNCVPRTVARRSCRPPADPAPPDAAGVAWSVRSTCSGVIDTRAVGRGVEVGARRRPRAHRRPGRSSRCVSPRGLIWRITGSLAWRRPRRVTRRGSAVGIGAVRDVDVEQPGRCRRRLGAAPARSRSRATRAAASRCAQPFCDLRERDRRNAEQVAFHRRGDGARVERVVAHVGAVVDAGDDQVGPVLEQPGERDVDAVGRRAVDVAKAVGRRVYTESGAVAA